MSTSLRKKSVTLKEFVKLEVKRLLEQADTQAGSNGKLSPEAEKALEQSRIAKQNKEAQKKRAAMKNSMKGISVEQIEMEEQHSRISGDKLESDEDPMADFDTSSYYDEPFESDPWNDEEDYDDDYFEYDSESGSRSVLRREPVVNIKHRDKSSLSEQVYLDDEAADELYLYIVNDGQLYRSQTQPIIKLLKKKKKKGVYDPKKALILWKYFADSGAKKYVSDPSMGASRKWSEVFPVSTRLEVAQLLQDTYEEELNEEEFNETSSSY